MISNKMQEAISQHISAEFYSAYLYLSMSAHCENLMFKGFGRWLRVQYQEELKHATKMMDYLLERGARPSFQPISTPPADFRGVLDVFEGVLAHERQVTTLVHNLFQLASAEQDHATQVFLQWFVAEQVEEEARALEIVEKLKMVFDRPASILYLDKEFGKRSS